MSKIKSYKYTFKVKITVRERILLKYQKLAGELEYL